MNKDWFHVQSLGRSIDLNVVSEIQWNEKDVHDKRFRTIVYLGTSIGVAEEYGIERPCLWIFAENDRKKLYAKFPGNPIDLLFDKLSIEDVKSETSSRKFPAETLPF